MSLEFQNKSVYIIFTPIITQVDVITAHRPSDPQTVLLYLSEFKMSPIFSTDFRQIIQIS